MESDVTWSFVSAFFLSASSFQGSSVLWLLSALRFILLRNDLPSCGCTIHCLSAHQLVHIWVGCFQCRALRISVAVNVCVQVFAWAYAFLSLGYLPRRRFAGSRGSSVLDLFFFFKFFFF